MADPARRRDQTRDDILEAAYALFLEKGYNGTSTRDIARHAGLALGGLYNHFEGKQDIFAAVLFERHPYLEIIPAVNRATGDSLQAYVRDAARRLADALRDRPAFLNLMFIEMVEFKARHVPDLVGKLLPGMSEFAQRFSDARARGEMRDMPLPIVMRAFLGMFFSYAITEQFSSALPAAYRQGALDYFVDIFLHGVSAPADARRPRAGRPAAKSKA